MDESDVTSKSTSDNENNFGLQKPKSRKRKSPNELIIDDIEIFEETRYESDEEESDEEDQLFQGEPHFYFFLWFGIHLIQLFTQDNLNILLKGYCKKFGILRFPFYC